MQRKVMTVGVVACVLAMMVGLSFAQAGASGGGQAGGQGGGRRGGGGGRGNFDPAQMRQMMADRLKTQLNVDDQAWKVMEPRIMKVFDLSRQANAGGRGMFGGRGGRGPGGGNGGPQTPQGEQTAVDKATAALSTTLENQSASPDDIKKQLTAVREARMKAQQDLAAAQADLKQILTLRQEAQLVLMGMLS
jgi:Spy/CpxP family protein refolding chaperone